MWGVRSVGEASSFDIKGVTQSRHLQNLSTGQTVHILATQLKPIAYTTEINKFTCKMGTTVSTSASETTKHQINRIKVLERKFRLSRSQLIHLDKVIEEIKIRYNRYQNEHHRSYRYILRQRLCILQGTRKMFYEYANAKADELEKTKLDLFNRTGIIWSDALAEELWWCWTMMMSKIQKL